MNYSRFGAPAVDNGLVGFFSVQNHTAASDKFWACGSVMLSIRVDYANSGASCATSNTFLTGFSAISQYTALSYKNWYYGSEEHKNRGSCYSRCNSLELNNSCINTRILR